LISITVGESTKGNWGIGTCARKGKESSTWQQEKAHDPDYVGHREYFGTKRRSQERSRDSKINLPKVHGSMVGRDKVGLSGSIRDTGECWGSIG
jgi:hypothetical protein